MNPNINLKTVKQDQARSKRFAELKQIADKEVLRQQLSAPKLSKQDRQQIEKMIEQIKKDHEYTFFCGREKERIEEHYQSIGKPVPFNELVAPGETSVTLLETAYRRSTDLKRKVFEILNTYKTFAHQYPDPMFGGATTIAKMHRYDKPDPEVLRIEKEVEEMRSYGEQEMHEFKKLGGDPSYYIGPHERNN
ncbi:hypothetical protein CSV61_16090 [Sporosarcina sp. P3]|uniref:hypothetical protein n=1 Tax=Sporosarcina sp. P3 TaxID=2048245 RepID=UPI000C16316C|nr:hypothetical protein [Sporosarcina sp. P3]PID20168.1 hypothetical protein CSV61_16090 [Sporosarcina sp. P3]